MRNFIQKISAVNYITLIKAGFLGLLSAEAFFLSKVISLKLNDYLVSSNHELAVLTLTVFSSLLIIVYLGIRGVFQSIITIIKSWRIDVFIAFGLGISLSVFFGGIWIEKYKYVVSLIDVTPLIILVLLPLALGLLLLLRLAQIWLIKRQNEESPFFISDSEQKFIKDDLLNYSDEAIRFAERIYNDGSSDSLVFGIDAPWGIGKSSFVNFCIESWKDKKYDKKIIVYKFNPLKYEGRSNLLEKFVDGLVRTIQKNAYLPEIRPLFSKYSRFISGKASFSFHGINFEIFPGTYTADDAFDDLDSALENLNRKIIVIVDDLDRLSFSAVKDVLFNIKKSFTLPNISYVLCYDTENIISAGKQSDDVDKIREFLEKFVNVKISLFLDSATLSKYVTDNFGQALKNNLQLDPYTLEKIKRAIEGLVDIYKSSDFDRYQPFLGDIRKLKRLINTLVLFEIEKVDFENSDFNKQDLIHLLLIYINYPNIFRKIYNAEIGGKRSFFSLVAPYEDNYPKNENRKFGEKEYKNSTKYSDFIKGLPANQQFLLNKIFAVSERFKNPNIDSISEEAKKTYACFNGGWGSGRNLEEYLNLIVKLAKPQKRGQYRFYLNSKNRLLRGESIEKVLSDKDFAYSESENSHEQFWRVITNSLSEFNKEAGDRVITYLLKNIQNYSMLTNEEIGVGFRHSLALFLTVILDNVGWIDGEGKHSQNNENNISEIAEWIFGDKRHLNSGVLQVLGDGDRGILGLYDLLAFRLFCSSDRGGDIYNLQRALLKHNSPSMPVSGATVKDEMREISQKVYQIFKETYVDKNINIFDLIDNLTLEDLTGKYLKFVKAKIKSKEVKDEDIERGVAELKSQMKAFITYQLGNSFISQGVGCGIYDSSGNADKNGIKNEVNQYLFNICFNPEKNPKNFEHFVGYLLINLANTFSSESDHKYVPSIDEFTKVLNREMLVNYWKKHSVSIRALNLPTQDKKIITVNYSASYKDLEKIFKLFDDLGAPSEIPMLVVEKT